MKKVLVVALMLVAGLAYAGSLAVPWFVDSAPGTDGNPPQGNGVAGSIYLNNTSTEELEVTIEYFTAVGDSIGPATFNTFVIAPKASLGFRPVQDGGESIEAAKIPNRPMSTVPPNDNKKNGSCTMTWAEPAGGGGLVGAYFMNQIATRATSATDPTAIYTLGGYGHLLPAL